MVSLIKLSCLQKNASKFTPKKFYEMTPGGETVTQR